MIALKTADVLNLLDSTKGKSSDQIEVEAEVKRILDLRKPERLTEQDLEKLFEEAGMEVALRKIAAKMRKDGKLDGLNTLKPLISPANLH